MPQNKRNDLESTLLINTWIKIDVLTKNAKIDRLMMNPVKSMPYSPLVNISKNRKEILWIMRWLDLLFGKGKWVLKKMQFFFIFFQQ